MLLHFYDDFLTIGMYDFKCVVYFGQHDIGFYPGSIKADVHNRANNLRDTSFLLANIFHGLLLCFQICCKDNERRVESKMKKVIFLLCSPEPPPILFIIVGSINQFQWKVVLLCCLDFFTPTFGVLSKSKGVLW